MSDRWITRMAREHGLIEPFEPGQVREVEGRRVSGVVAVPGEAQPTRVTASRDGHEVSASLGLDVRGVLVPSHVYVRVVADGVTMWSQASRHQRSRSVRG